MLFSFRFCFLSTSQEIGWDECLKNDLLYVVGLFNSVNQSTC